MSNMPTNITADPVQRTMEEIASGHVDQRGLDLLEGCLMNGAATVRIAYDQVKAQYTVTLCTRRGARGVAKVRSSNLAAALFQARLAYLDWLRS